MEQINYEQLIPQKPTADVVSFAQQNGAFQTAYLIYRSDREYVPLEDRFRDAVHVVCSECGEQFYEDKIPAGGCSQGYAPAPFGWYNSRTGEQVISGSTTICPHCMAEARTVHIGNMRLHNGELVDDAWVTELSRLPINGARDRLVLTDWCVRRCINKAGAARYEVWPYTAWVVEEKRIVRLMGYMKNIGGAISLFGEWRQRKTFSDVYGNAELVLPWDKSLLEGTTAENSKLNLYHTEKRGRRLVGYLALWRRHPNVENLLVQGCGNLVRTWINQEADSGYYHGGIPKLKEIIWKEKRPAQMLGLTKEEFRHLRQMRWNTEDLEKYKLVRDCGVPVRLPEDIDLLRTVRTYDCNKILEEAPKADFWRILRYLKKQKRDWSVLRDYWNMAERLGRDLNESLVRWPRNLLYAHDQVTGEQKCKAEEVRRAGFAQRAGELAELSFSLDGLLIRPCANEEELIAEGKDLHHCVATYAQRHAEGRTAILFIRREKEPEVPYFTLEFDEKNLLVLQNRGLRNCARTPEVAAFEKTWLEWVRHIKTEGRIRVA